MLFESRRECPVFLAPARKTPCSDTRHTPPRIDRIATNRPLCFHAPARTGRVEKERSMEGSVADTSTLPKFDQSAAASAPNITQAEYDKVIRQFNNTAADLPEDGSVHGCFEGQVELTPHAIA